MDKTVSALLAGGGGNHMLPFFWQHGEDEATLREYMRVIHGGGCGAVCVESRPHPDFCGPRWWADMDVILDEARRRGMKVWILDDSHFPTGYANGALENAPNALCRQSVHCHKISLGGGARALCLNLSKHIRPMRVVHPNPAWRLAMRFISKKQRVFDDDRLLSVTAFGPGGQALALDEHLADNVLRWYKPAGRWELAVCVLSRNAGPHRTYINVMDAASCRVLIDSVYEPHWQRYKADFGTTIAGFFSDEPELGNGVLYPQGNLLGTGQDLPWSSELEAELMRRLGGGWQNQLPLLWKNDADVQKTADLRYTYMDAVTRLARRDFSEQLGGWCREHGVEYIGHVIEDNNQHARTGSSLGHYFRALAGQDMAGIDDIGGQVLPQGEDLPEKGALGTPRDGAFYHYVLGKLAASAAAIEPRKKGRAMCEIFGNYGWAEGVQLEKYLADHFLVRGVNEYVPHAFSPKPYPDPDCPPHFHAHGHNPQYRHFGALMGYMNRVSELISGGAPVCPVAVLYHAEAEWTGRAMLTQVPARRLYDSQIDFLILPQDVFAEPETYNTRLGATLEVNGNRFKALVVPYAQFVTEAFAKAAAALWAAGFPVIFIDALPEGLCGGGAALPQALQGCPVLKPEELVPCLAQREIPDIGLSPPSKRIRVLRYRAQAERYLVVNEAAEAYSGTLTLPGTGPCYGYDAWHNTLHALEAREAEGGTALAFTLEPRKSLIVIFDEAGAMAPRPPGRQGAAGAPVALEGWRRALCRAAAYPAFGTATPVRLPDDLAREQPAFSGYARYTSAFYAEAGGRYLLEVSDAAEGVEVLVNGQSAGIQIVPAYRYELTGLVRPGQNELAIEVATTLERERAAAPKKGLLAQLTAQKPSGASGLTGTVTLTVLLDAGHSEAR